MMSRYSLARIRKFTFVPLFVLLLAGASASAQLLTGTVKNSTTNKPAAGDDVVLIKLAQGMEEAARTKTDSAGKFSVRLEDSGGPHLIRVIHQGVTYHRMAPPGTTSVEVEVYDVAKKVEGINAVADLMYVQTGQGQLGINRLFAVDNNSKPRRTQMNDQNFEFYLPQDVQIDQAQAQTAGGQWVESAPVPQPEKGRYAFVFPLRPGTTQFQVSYHLPYNGSAKIDPKPLYALQHFVVILPKTIQFSAAQSGVYQEKQPPDQQKSIAEVAAGVQVGQSLSFAISGNGVLQEESAGGGGESASPEAGSAEAARDSRPGGGLGPPIEAPDPLEKSRWYILGGFAVVLAAGAIYIAKRPRTVPAGVFAASDLELPETPSATKRPASERSGLLLEALKEELFQLEVEHKQGTLSQEEYEKAKAALDQTLERALKRGAPK
jgi:hypothetical protein